MTSHEEIRRTLLAKWRTLFRLDFYYFCYDNEAYGNAGVQLSSSTT